MQHGYSPRSGNGKTANSDLDPGAESSDGQQTVSTLLDRQAYTTNDALDLLHEAAQHGKSAIATETSAGSVHGSSNWHSSPTKSGFGKGRGAIDVALKSWCTLLFVRDGLLTAEEALSYVDWFYNSLAPLSPIPSARFQNHSQHKNLLEKEPILAVTMLTLASRYMKLSGPGAITRGFVIHDRLWNYLRGMISRVFWSEETFTSMDQVSHSETMFPGSPDTRPGTPSSVLRTMGTCEALLLLLEWYPRTLHFPPADNDINSIIVRDGTSNYMTSQGRYGRLRSGVDWLKRSDRMAWSLLGLAQSLATELGMFDKKDTSTDSHNHQFEEDMQRACRIKQLIWVFSIQTSGRLGWKYLPIFSISKQNGHSADDNTECWEGIASLLKKGHELLFSSSHNTMEIVSKRQYHPLLQILQAHLEDWRRIYEAAKLTKLMRSMLGIEYEYVRLYAYSIVLQSVVERRKGKGSIGEKSLNAEDEQDSDVLYDKLYLGYLTDAARSLLGIVVDDLFARGYLQYIPVRPYSRILAAALYLLKTSAIEMKEGEVRKSLSLVNRTAEALQSSMVDDIHLGPHWGVLLANLSSSISARATKSATQGSEMAQRLPIDSEASRYRSAHQDKIQPEHTSNPTTSSSSYATSLTSQPGTLNNIEHTNMYNLDPGQSSLNGDPAELNYDEMFLWPDPLSQISEIDMTQVPWNGDQAMFQILASVVDSEIK